MNFDINDTLFYIDDFYYLVDPLRSEEHGRYHVVLDLEDNKVKTHLLTKNYKRNENLLNRGVIIASNKFLTDTPHLPLSPFEDGINSVEIKTFGLGSPNEKAYMIDLVENNGIEEVVIINYKK
jgi:hypothetical protein